jgi:hypothetical protein
MIAAMLPKNDARNIFISILPSVFPLIKVRNHAIPRSRQRQFFTQPSESVNNAMRTNNAALKAAALHLNL